MTNNQHTQSTRNVLPRRLQHSQRVTPVRGVVQDNPAPPPAPSPTKQPAPRKKDARTAPKEVYTNSTHQKHNRLGKDVQLNLWVRPVVKAELERVAKREGLSVSAAGEALLEKALQQDIHTQHGALLEPIIDKSIAKHMRAYSNRLASLLVRSAFSSEQTRQIAANILSRQQIKPLMPPENLTTILDQSSKSAKRNITQSSPQLKTLIELVTKELREVEELKEGESERS